MLISPGILISAICTAAALLLFLRIAGKEVHRRERYLQLRLQEKLEEAKQKEEDLKQGPQAPIIAQSA